MASLGDATVEHAGTAALARFIQGRLPSAQAAFVCDHVMVCGACRDEAQEITALLWPSLSIWIKCWLRLFSPSWPPSRVLRFVGAFRRR